VASFILIPYFKTISIIYFKSESNGAAKTHPAKQTRALVSDFQEKTFLIHLFDNNCKIESYDEYYHLSLTVGHSETHCKIIIFIFNLPVCTLRSNKVADVS